MLPSHGANPELLFKKLNIPQPPQIIDFSENVNFAHIPTSIEERWQSYLPLLAKYPHPDGEPFLSAVANYHQLSKEEVLIGNGAAEIFTLLANSYAHQKVIIVHPTFSEYERTLRAQNVAIIHMEVEDIIEWTLPMNQLKQQMKEAAALYVCTPNNPTGVLPPREQLLELLKVGADLNCHIILDEAFIDWISEEESLVSELEHNPHLCIVRSMTKMYSIPGIRLGYALAKSPFITNLKKYVPNWNVNALAAHLGEVCLQEDEYRKASIIQANNRREKFILFLKENQCIVTNSRTNFVCFQLPDSTKSQAFYLDMLWKGIVMRHTENFKGLDGKWFRVGMKSSDQMLILEQEMIAWFASQRKFL